VPGATSLPFEVADAAGNVTRGEIASCPRPLRCRAGRQETCHPAAAALGLA
jgi:hypothetical protein